MQLTIDIIKLKPRFRQKHVFLTHVISFDINPSYLLLPPSCDYHRFVMKLNCARLIYQYQPSPIDLPHYFGGDLTVKAAWNKIQRPTYPSFQSLQYLGLKKAVGNWINSSYPRLHPSITTTFILLHMVNNNIFCAP